MHRTNPPPGRHHRAAFHAPLTRALHSPPGSAQEVADALRAVSRGHRQSASAASAVHGQRRALVLVSEDTDFGETTRILRSIAGEEPGINDLHQFYSILANVPNVL